LIGIILFAIAVVNFLVAPFDEFIDKGLYRYSRHPQYIAMPLMFIGMGIASASWVFLLVAIIFTLNLLFIRPSQEECYCLEKYGNAYREYINSTPRWLGIPKP
jgi:protein-S-isoprenylcysteine O-methyltransferase Ste14